MSFSTVHVSTLTALAIPAAAIPSYQSNIPNGNNVQRNGVAWGGVGHEASGGGGRLNSFGEAFRNAGRTWTFSLCNADTDGDGFTNGQELGDPNCMWTPGATPMRTTGISHPGYSDSTPQITPSTPAPTPSPFGQSAFSLHPSRTAECSTEEQQRMLREQSVSSLRGGLPERPDPTTGCVRGVSECYRVKRTLFLNEFPQFVFRPQQ